MNDEARSKTKDRSPSFPFISLEAALVRAQQFYKEEKKGAAPLPSVALHWNYSQSSSGCLQTVSALKNYGLMSDEGSGAQRKFRLTDLAFRILLDQRPGSTERAALLREAALAPAVAHEIYSKWPEGLPSSATLHHFLVFDLSFGDEFAKKVVKILVANQEFVGLSESGVSYEDQEEGEDMQTAKRSQTPAPAQAPIPSPVRALPDSRTERLVVLDGEAIVTIEYTGAQSAEVFDFIEQYGKFRKSMAKATPKPAASESEI